MLDWFAEDPWDEPDTEGAFGEDEWYPGLWEPTDGDETLGFSDVSDPWGEYADRGRRPTRRRRRANSRP